MAAVVITPVDAIGMPLPLAPNLEAINDAGPHQMDWHHHFHPRRSPILTRDLGGQAVRNVRLQHSDWWQHHIDYHSYFQGPPLPVTKGEQFGLVVLASAGYVPSEAIDFHRGNPRIVRMSAEQRKYLWTESGLKTTAPDIVRKFLIEYTLAQSLEGVDERVIDEFQHASTALRRYNLGGIILNAAIEEAVEPLTPFYKEAWWKGHINRTSSSRPQRLVKARLDIKRDYKKLIDRLYANLAA